MKWNTTTGWSLWVWVAGDVLVNYAWRIIRLGSATIISSRRLIAINCDIYIWLRETLNTGKRSHTTLSPPPGENHNTALSPTPGVTTQNIVRVPGESHKTVHYQHTRGSHNITLSAPLGKSHNPQLHLHIHSPSHRFPILCSLQHKRSSSKIPTPSTTLIPFLL